MIVRTAFECNRPALRLVQCRTDAHRPVVKTPDMQFLQQLAAEKKERISKPDERRLFAIYGQALARMEELAKTLGSKANEDSAAISQELKRLEEAKGLAETIVTRGLGRLVWKKARGIRRPAGVKVEDLVQVGEAAIVKYAMPKFDLERGTRFYSYAMDWAKRAMWLLVYEEGNEIRKPPYLHLVTNRVEKFSNARFCLTGRYPDIDEIADGTGLRRSAIINSSSVPRIISMHQKLPRDGPRRIEMIPDRRAGTPEEMLSQREIAERLLATLKPREAGMIRSQFGVGGCQPRTPLEIGMDNHVSRQRVMQIISEGKKKMRETLLRHRAEWGYEAPREEGPAT